MCSLWQDCGCGSFIKTLTRPHGQWMHCSACCPLRAGLCFSFSLPFSLCVCVSLYAPSSSSLSCETLALTVVETTSPQPCSFFFCLTLHLSLFSYTPLCQFLFFCAVVRVSGLFSFKLNTFQLCMNHTSHKSGYAKADVTELPLHVYVKCTWVLVRLCAHMKISR